MDKISRLQLFCRVTELGSYSEVARERSMSRSGVSRAMTTLEQEFGVQVFKRSTRSLSLSEAGRELYNEAERILRQFETMEDRIRRDRSEIAGLLRVGVPGPLSERFILPDLPLFYEKYPQVKLFFQVSENLSDIYRDELDMVIRMGAPRDSSLVSVHLSDLNFTLAAAPGFIASHQDFKHPSQLKGVNCLCFRGRGRGTSWELFQNNEKVTVPVSGFISADCGYTLRSMAKKGLGVVAMPNPLLKKELESGELVPIMTDWSLAVNAQDWGIHLLYHADRHPLKRVRAFIDFMKEPERLIQQANKVRESE